MLLPDASRRMVTLPQCLNSVIQGKTRYHSFVIHNALFWDPFFVLSCTNTYLFLFGDVGKFAFHDNLINEKDYYI